MPRFRPIPCHLATAATLMLAAFVAHPTKAMAQSTDPVPEQAARWIRGLDADQFAQRKKARNELVKIGAPAIPLIKQTVLQNPGQRELQMQALEILQALVAQADATVRQTAIDALSQIATQSKDHRSGNAAKRLLADHQRLIALDAWNQLKELGAKSTENQLRTPIGQENELPDGIVIDQQWRGSADDVRFIGLLPNLKELRLVGKSIDDEYLVRVSKLKRLVTLWIDESNITANGLTALADLKTLGTVTVRNTLLTNEDGGLATALQGLTATTIRLVRTQLSQEDVAKVAEAIPSTKATLHFGAFLGVGPIEMQIPNAKGCELGRVSAGSAAAKAGLRVADTIVKYGDKPINNFAELRDLIGLDSPGDKVKIELHRPKRPRQDRLEDLRIEPPNSPRQQIEKQNADGEQPENERPNNEAPAANDPNAGYDVLVKEVTLGELHLFP